MKRYIVRFAIFLSILIAVNFALEPIAKYYVNKTLSEIDGYSGSIHDIDIALWRGAYRIDSLKIDKLEGSYREPFVSIPGVDISIEWQALFHGSIKGEIVLEQPNLNFTTSESGEVQTGSDQDWLSTIENLVPIQINRFEIQEGTVNYKDYVSSPEVSVTAQKINAIATNLSTIQNKDSELPSHIELTSTTSGNGELAINLDMNLLQPLPDFDLSFELQQMDLTYLTDFTKAYGGFTFKKGSMNVFSEVSMKDSAYVGYVKPLMKNISIIGKNQNASWVNKTWEAIVGTVFEVFENQPQDQFATKIPFEGDVKNTDVAIFKTATNVLRNAFVKAYDNQIDQTITVNSVKDKNQ